MGMGLHDPPGATVTECKRCQRLKRYTEWKFPEEMGLSRQTLLDLTDIPRRYVEECDACKEER